MNKGPMTINTLLGVSREVPIEAEVARLLVETLNLEIDPASIDPIKPLFREGLGLDSIDALEIALAISKHYGFQLRSDDGNNRDFFASLRSLSSYIQQHRTR
jgi:acyl carrier protein